MRSGPRVLVFPAYRDNPFLNLLQLAGTAAGYRIEGANTYDDLMRAARTLNRGDVVHLHWTTPILQQAQTRAAAERRLRAVRRLLERMREHGVRLLWTVHNRLPHELTFRELEIELMGEVASHADLIHIMAPHTPAALADIVRLDPEKVRILPHPSYEGVYDTGLGPDAARASFSLAPRDLAVLFLGQIRPYKGVDALVGAAAEAAARRDDRAVRLLVAGAVKEMSREDFAATIPAGLAAATHLDFVPDGDIARWFAAADVAVFPYRAILNSGSVHLAATFRVPVVLPADPHLERQFADEPWVAFFDPARPAESLADLLADPALFAGVTAESFDAFLAPISPWETSRRYAALLAELTAESPRALSA
ncbi:glycosyltransferase [Microbacterium sp. ZXX196]|uniref:glycosyltransferase n=1 Tax=Microbacterium sp. ZXX196 TaxID=2609291 RepID=UPI0012B8BAE7|nr:glycosyltransferase [Microbacterium sp. ZXX196]MTE22729.1 glycosyltransferase [Microbacterium sp. ZXX196]